MAYKPLSHQKITKKAPKIGGFLNLLHKKWPKTFFNYAKLLNTTYLSDVFLRHRRIKKIMLLKGTVQ
jgi:hypothetical protein